MLKLREHIHSRMAEVRGSRELFKTVKEFWHHVSEVWKAVEASHFDLRFKTLVDRILYQTVERSLLEYQNCLSRAYYFAYEKQASQIRSYKTKVNDSSDMEDLFRSFVEEMENEVNPEREERGGKVCDLARYNRYKQWETELISRVKTANDNQKEHWKQCLRSTFNTVMLYDCATDKLKSKLRIEIDNSFAKFKSCASMLSDTEKSRIFEELFKSFMDSVKKEFPATSADIDQKIFRVLAQVKSIDSTSTNFLKTLSDYASIT